MTSYAWVVPGAKCVLVEPNPEWVGPDMPNAVSVPVVGKPYTIRKVGRCFAEPAITLEEICNRPMMVEGPPDVLWEACFALWRFRPLVTRTIEQDVAIFAPWLHDQPVEA